MTMQTRTSRGMNAQGRIVETIVRYDPDVVAARKAFRDAQRQATDDQAWLKDQALSKIIADTIAADPNLSAHKVAVDAVLAIKPGNALPVLPARPNISKK